MSNSSLGEITTVFEHCMCPEGCKDGYCVEGCSCFFCCVRNLPPNPRGSSPDCMEGTSRSCPGQSNENKLMMRESMSTGGGAEAQNSKRKRPDEDLNLITAKGTKKEKGGRKTVEEHLEEKSVLEVIKILGDRIHRKKDKEKGKGMHCLLSEMISDRKHSIPDSLCEIDLEKWPLRVDMQNIIKDLKQIKKDTRQMKGKEEEEVKELMKPRLIDIEQRLDELREREKEEAKKASKLAGDFIDADGRTDEDTTKSLGKKLRKGFPKLFIKEASTNEPNADQGMADKGETSRKGAAYKGDQTSFNIRNYIKNLQKNQNDSTGAEKKYSSQDKGKGAKVEVVAPKDITLSVELKATDSAFKSADVAYKIASSMLPPVDKGELNSQFTFNARAGVHHAWQALAYISMTDDQARVEVSKANAEVSSLKAEVSSLKAEVETLEKRLERAVRVAFNLCLDEVRHVHPLVDLSMISIDDLKTVPAEGENDEDDQ